MCDSLDKFEAAMVELKRVFKHVFFVPGNHDLWVRKAGNKTPVHVNTAVDKLRHLDGLCKRLGVLTEPTKLRRHYDADGKKLPVHQQNKDFVWVVPLYSWYDRSFGQKGPLPAGTKPEEEKGMQAWSDFYLVKWPHGWSWENAAEKMLDMNKERVHKYDAPVITFSHFVPRREMVPNASVLMFKGLPLVAGDVNIDRQIRACGAHTHVFGHTHINWEKTIDNVRYVQHALRYPRERTMFGRKPFALEQVYPFRPAKYFG